VQNAPPFSPQGDIPISDLPTKKSGPRTAKGVFAAWEHRTALVKQEMAAESAANDAKTARLKALRLEKEAQDAEAARISALNAPPAPVKKRAKRSV
jgi:hypothetical protein